MNNELSNAIETISTCAESVSELSTALDKYLSSFERIQKTVSDIQKHEESTASIGFEKQIWDAACVLRGNIDASEYKSVVLGLIFLKYISDRFDEKYQQLVEEGDGFEEDVDEYISEGIFFVPETARWSVIASKAHTPEIGTVIDEAMRAIEKENKRLKDILP